MKASGKVAEPVRRAENEVGLAVVAVGARSPNDDVVKAVTVDIAGP